MKDRWSISWHAIGVLIKLAIGLTALLVGLRLADSLWPDRTALTAFLVAVFIAWLACGAACTLLALLVSFGRLGVRCPLCNARGTLMPHGRYTWLSCPRCGAVHATGFWKATYFIDDDVEAAAQRARRR